MEAIIFYNIRTFNLCIGPNEQDGTVSIRCKLSSRNNMSSQPFKQSIKLFWLFIAAVSIVLLIMLFRLHPDPNFWFVPNLPVPSYAQNLESSNMPLSSGSMGGYRIIKFETDQPIEAIQQFYRSELSRRGWHFLCSPAELEQPGCPLGLSPSVELAEAYSRDDEPSKVRAIDLEIYKPGGYLASFTDRVVEIIEYRYPVTNP